MRTITITAPGPQGIQGEAGAQGPPGVIPNTGSFATTGSNNFNGNQTITGSLIQGLGNAAGENSHAEGDSTRAIGSFSHAEGLGTIAYGGRSHAEGQDTIASGSYSHAEGYQTIALADHQHVQGQWNAASSVPAAFIVGNGTDDSNRSNLIHAAGNEVQITGSLTVSGATTMSSALVSGNVTVLGTASINVLQINTTINSTGSNQLGDAPNDTQTLYGSVIVPTGSLTISASSGVYPLSFAGNPTIYGAEGMNLRVDTKGVFFSGTSQTHISTYGTGVPLTFSLNGGAVEKARFAATTGNFLINTTTDSGFKLDVNGTARVGAAAASGQLYIKGLSGTGQYLYFDNGTGNGLWTVVGGAVFAIDSVSTRILRANANAQVTINGDTNAASAQFQIDSTTRGFLPPRTNTTASISSPAQGLMTYLTGSTNEGLYYYNSGSQTGWHKVLTNTGSQDIIGSLTMAGSIFTSGYIGYPNNSRYLQFNDADSLVRLQGFNGIRLATYDTAGYTDVIKIDGNVATRTIQVTGSLRTSGSMTILGTDRTLYTQAVTNITADGYLYFGDGTRIGSTGGSNIHYASGYYSQAAHQFYGGTAAGMTSVVDIYGGQSGKPALRASGSVHVTGSLSISGVTTFAQGSSVNGSGNLAIGAFSVHSSFGYATFSQTTLLLTGATFTSTTGNQIGLSFGGGFTPTSGTATYSAYSILPTINQTGGANGITRGLYVNPTLTSAADFRAIETTSGSISFNHGSTPLLFASTNGNVGIGTGSAAAYKLQVRNGDIALDFNRYLRGGFDNNWNLINLYNGSTGDLELFMFNTNWYLRHNANATFAGNVGIGLTGSISNRLHVKGSGATSATTALRVENTNASASMVVLDNGFVGINTGSAQYNLDVNGTTRINGQLVCGTINPGTTANIAGMTVYQGTIDPSSNYDIRLVVPTATKGVVVSQDYSFLSSGSALFEVKSTTKGFLPPRMTNAQRTSISAPAVGLMVYCTDATEGLYIYKSTGWTFIM